MSKPQQKDSKPAGRSDGLDHSRGLGGMCFVEHPTDVVHCCEPVGHEQRYREHYHPYSQTTWV